MGWRQEGDPLRVESMIILNKYHRNIGLALAIKMIAYFPKLTGVQIQKYYFKIIILEPIGFGAVWCVSSAGRSGVVWMCGEVDHSSGHTANSKCGRCVDAVDRTQTYVDQRFMTPEVF